MSSTPPNDPWVKPVIIGSSLLILVTVGVLVGNLFSTISSNSTIGTIQAATPETTDTSAGDSTTPTQTAKPTASTENTESEQTTQTAVAEPEEKPAEPTQPAVANINGEKVYKGICFSCHDMGIAGAPKLDDKAAWDERIKAGVDSIYNVALNGKGAMPAKGGNPALSDDEVKAAVNHMLAAAGVNTDNADSTDQTAATDDAASTEPATAASHASINGEKVYKGICFSCHDMGIAGAPKVGDKGAWTDRITAGNESMYNIAINGKGAMPAKGGNPALSDDEIKAAVDYMVSTVQ